MNLQEAIIAFKTWPTAKRKFKDVPRTDCQGRKKQ